MYFTDGKLSRANRCSNSTLLSLLSPLLILCNEKQIKQPQYVLEKFDQVKDLVPVPNTRNANALLFHAFDKFIRCKTLKGHRVRIHLKLGKK